MTNRVAAIILAVGMVSVSGCGSDQTTEDQAVSYVDVETFIELRTQLEAAEDRIAQLESSAKLSQQANEQRSDELNARIAAVDETVAVIAHQLEGTNEVVTRLTEQSEATVDKLVQLQQRTEQRRQRQSAGPEFSFRTSSINQIGPRYYIAIARNGSSQYDLRSEGQSVGDGWRVDSINGEERTATFVHRSGKVVERVI